MYRPKPMKSASEVLHEYPVRKADRQTDRQIDFATGTLITSIGGKKQQIDYKVASHLEDGALFLLGFPQEGILL